VLKLKKMKEVILNINELSSYLKCSVSTIRNLVKKSKIPYFRIGVKLYFKLTSIEEWICKNEQK